jgi:hypothetical protein
MAEQKTGETEKEIKDLKAGLKKKGLTEDLRDESEKALQRLQGSKQVTK